MGSDPVRKGRNRTLILIVHATRQSSSFIGPLVVGLVADLTGDIRYAFLFLVAVLWAALPVLAGVDVERGRVDARAWSSEEGENENDVEYPATEAEVGVPLDRVRSGEYQPI